MEKREKLYTLWGDDKINEEEMGLLRQKTKDIPAPFDAAGGKDIKTLVEAFLKRDDAFGLAAPQIGISKRVTVFKNKNLYDREPVTSERDYDVLVNPRITQFRGETEIMMEGCLSCPDINVEVERYTEIKVKAYNIKGQKISRRYTGFLARVVQHECDHLDGKLIIDRGSRIQYPKEKEEFFNSIFQMGSQNLEHLGGIYVQRYNVSIL
ncbi:MAG: peptide deformylase [Syntrophaceae bacterium]|nr:peptide deformylase [Syntrophaceae bacterium]